MHGWGRPRRRERLFERGELKYLFLDLLREKPRHGYDLIRAIDERSAGRYTASPGAVYPILQMLEDQGLLSVKEAEGRKTYAVTAAGETFLGEHAAALEDVRRRIEGAWDGPPGRDDWAGLMRELAMFRHAFGRGRRPSPEAMKRIFAIVERARREIEAVLEEDRGGF